MTESHRQSSTEDVPQGSAGEGGNGGFGGVDVPGEGVKGGCAYSDDGREGGAGDSDGFVGGEIRAIRRVEASEIEEAFQYLWVENGKSNAELGRRFIRFAQESGLALDQCWACERRDGRLFPVCLAVPNAGRSAMLFVSHLTDRRREDELAHLLSYAGQRLDSSRVRIAQALLNRLERRSRKAFERAGFFHLADLSYLERKISISKNTGRGGDVGMTGEWPRDTSVEAYCETVEDDFKKAIAASYEDTLDCPRLCGLRSLDDVLKGHKSTGEFDPKMWTLVRVRGEPAAVLLLSHFADQDVVELTYLGVGVPFRGMGLGRLLVERAIEMAGKARSSRITLAVDDQNGPAMQLYRRTGFRRIDRRVAMILAVAEEEERGIR